MRRTTWRLGMAMLLAGAMLAGGCRKMAVRVPDMAMTDAGMAASSALAARDAAGMPESEAKAATGVDTTSNVTDRLLIYDATVHLVVEDVEATLTALKAMAAELKGYMQEMTEASIALRIPAADFSRALARLTELGEVASREIKGADVTEEMRDLDIRLRNLEEMRARLIKLMDRGEKVEDLLKVEQELGRVTEAIELCKGKIQYLRHAVAYSTLRVNLNSPVPQKEMKEAVPFAWVRNLGSDVIVSPDASFEPVHRLFTWLKVQLPPAYVRLYEVDGYTRAISAEGVMVLIQRSPNFEGGTLDFWSRMIRRWLAGARTIAVAEEKPLTLGTGAQAALLEGTRTYGGKPYEYVLVTAVTRREVFTFECWGPAEAITRDRPQIEEAARSMRIRP